MPKSHLSLAPAEGGAAPTGRPTSPARRVLEGALAARAVEQAAHTKASIALTAASGLADQERAVQAKLDHATAEAATRIAAWATAGGGADNQPVAGDEIAGLRRDLDLAAAMASAARAAMPGLQATMNDARARLDVVRVTIGEAVKAVLIEDAQSIDAEILQAQQHIVELRVRLVGLAEHLARTQGAARATQELRMIMQRPAPEPDDDAIRAAIEPWRASAAALLLDATTGTSIDTTTGDAA